MPTTAIDRAIRPCAVCADDVLVWRVDLDAYAERADRALLDDGETARAQRLKFERDQRRFRSAHVALRQVLAHTLARAPAALAFTHGEFGKPRLADDAIEFNLSHSDGLALIAVGGRRALGVDVECPRRHHDVDALARVCCTAPETQTLQALDADARQHAFLRLWTRKEAYLKALGLGLSRGPEAIEVGIAPAVTPADGIWHARLPVEGDARALALWSWAMPDGALGALAVVPTGPDDAPPDGARLCVYGD